MKILLRGIFSYLFCAYSTSSLFCISPEDSVQKKSPMSIIVMFEANKFSSLEEISEPIHLVFSKMEINKNFSDNYNHYVQKNLYIQELTLIKCQFTPKTLKGMFRLCKKLNIINCNLDTEKAEDIVLNFDIDTWHEINFSDNKIDIVKFFENIKDYDSILCKVNLTNNICTTPLSELTKNLIKSKTHFCVIGDIEIQRK